MTHQVGQLDYTGQVTGGIGISVVIILLTIRDDALKTLLVRTDGASWRLPAGTPGDAEPLRRAAERVVREYATISVDYLEQLYTFGNRVSPDRQRMIEIAYYGLVPPDLIPGVEQHAAGRLAWFSEEDEPELQGEHGLIVRVARNRLQGKLAYTAVGFELLPELFSMAELQRLYEIILGRELDKRNFRKKILDLGIVEDTGESRAAEHQRGRPAALYRFQSQVFRNLEAKRDILAF
ncbi:NUDIX domain-containing protein [bacterium]|nr:NUDIX domain-containing protein [bacterium]